MECQLEDRGEIQFNYRASKGLLLRRSLAEEGVEFHFLALTFTRTGAFL